MQKDVQWESSLWMVCITIQPFCWAQMKTKSTWEPGRTYSLSAWTISAWRIYRKQYVYTKMFVVECRSWFWCYSALFCIFYSSHGALQKRRGKSVSLRERAPRYTCGVVIVNINVKQYIIICLLCVSDWLFQLHQDFTASEQHTPVCVWNICLQSQLCLHCETFFFLLMMFSDIYVYPW